MAFKGFKRLTIRVLDGNATPTLGENLFVVEGVSGKGATRMAKITGLAADVVKTYGSNLAYHASSRGVGDVKMELTTIDLPWEMIAKILGYKINGNRFSIGADTTSPYCSVMLETETAAGYPAYTALFKGQFSRDGVEMETLKDKQEELAEDSLTYAAIASDAKATQGEYYTQLVKPTEQELKQLQGELGMTVAA